MQIDVPSYLLNPVKNDCFYRAICRNFLETILLKADE